MAKRNKAISVNDPRLPAIVQRLKDGGSLTAESRELGFSNNHILRDALRGLLGRKKYDTLMSGRNSLGIKRWREAQAAKAKG